VKAFFCGSAFRSLTRNSLSCALPLRSHRNRRYVPRQRFQQAYARPPSGLRDSATSAYPPLFFPRLLLTGYFSMASRLTGRRRITRPMMSRVSSADTSPTCLCVARRVRAPYSFSHCHCMTKMYVFLNSGARDTPRFVLSRTYLPNFPFCVFVHTMTILCQLANGSSETR
jgi:hypothetical protein